MKHSSRLYLPKRRADLFQQLAALPKARLLGALICAIGAAGSGGCSTLGAKPWEHDLLAERAMQVRAYPIEAGMDDHIYFSKEASSGGRSFAGGGCGCN
jgi:uncharacterized protein DUF4266